MKRKKLHSIYRKLAALALVSLGGCATLCPYTMDDASLFRISELNP